jgi:transposase InsO family protein
LARVDRSDFRLPVFVIYTSKVEVLRRPVESAQYCSNEYQRRLSKHGFKVSMSGKGNCYDNSMVETFFKSIKAELIWRNRWDTRRQAERAIFQYINGFYNPRRRHSSLGGKSPLAFERKAA